MIKVSFKEPSYKKVERFNDKVTIVTLTGIIRIPKSLRALVPGKVRRWYIAHENPSLTFYGETGDTIISKGKALRSDKDNDNPLLAERIAESRAKLKIYSFVHSLISKYIIEYTKLITGKDNLFSSSEETCDSLYGMADRYSALIATEKKHLEDLIAQS